MKYEIWLGDTYGCFERGVAHTEDGRTIELNAWVHQSTYGSDTLLIDDEENFKSGRFPLRWYIRSNGLDFYVADSDIIESILFHNEGSVDLRVNTLDILPIGECLEVRTRGIFANGGNRRLGRSIKRKARYQWSADGISELCDFESMVMPEDTQCYHCSNTIVCGSTCVKLIAPEGDTYLLHDACFYQNTIPV